MPAAQLKRLTPRHDTILAFIMANPRIKRREVAVVFGVTEAWLSTIVNSDIFQARLGERTDQIFCETLVPLRDKIESIAHRSLDKLAEGLDSLPLEGQFKTAEMALKMAGYGSKHNLGVSPAAVQNTQINLFAASPEMLSAARQRLGAETPVRQAIEAPALEALVTEGGIG